METQKEVKVWSDIDQTLMPLAGMLGLYRNYLEIEGIFPMERIFEFARQERKSDPNRPRRIFTTDDDQGIVRLLNDPNLAFSREEFWPVREIVRENHRFHLTTSPLPKAQQGLGILDEIWPLEGYLTVRPETDLMRLYTKTWLNRFNFPKHKRVTICQNPAHKLEIMLQKLREDPQLSYAVLIDDGLSSLIKAINDPDSEFDKKDRENLERIILVGFGHYPEDLRAFTRGSISPKDGTQIHQLESGVWVASLPTWSEENVSNLVTNVNSII